MKPHKTGVFAWERAFVGRILVSFACGLAAVGASGEVCTWKYDASKGSSPMSPALFSEPSNWVDGHVPTQPADIMDLSTATGRYIRLDQNLKLTRFRGVKDHNPTIMGSGSLVFTGFSAQTQAAGESKYMNIFVPLIASNTLNNAWTRFGEVQMAADLDVPSGFCTVGGQIHLRMDQYANDSSPVRTGQAFKDSINIHYSHILFYAPQSSPTNMTSRWTLTQGSAFAVATAPVSHALPVGTLVSSEGFLPDGAFLKRIYPDGTIEFSAAALGSGEADVEFAAFTPRVHQKIYGFGRSVADTPMGGFVANKWREEDELRVEVGSIYSTQSTRPATFRSSTGWLPGTFVLKNGTSTNAWVHLVNSRVEFAGTDDKGTDAGVPNGTLAMGTGYTTDTKNYRGYVVVTNGITAKVANLQNIYGRLVKEGAGTLVVGLPDNAATTLSGTIEVKEGVFAVRDSVDMLMKTLPNVVVSNGASLKIPSTGLMITKSAVFAEGSSVVGPGILALPAGTDFSLVPTDGTVQMIYVSQTEFDSASTSYSWDDEIEAATSPLDEGLPVPASWMDASVASTLVTSNGDTQVCLLRWNDVRGEGYPHAYAASETKFAEVVTNSAGRPHHVFIKEEPSNIISKTRALWYSPYVSKVKAVFKVWNGDGALVCGYDDWKCMRPDSTYVQYLFYNNATYKVNGRYYVNGELRDQKAQKGNPYKADSATDKSRFDPEVSEFHFEGNELSAAKTISFHTGGGNNTSRNGRDRICEMILYTNELTFVQRQKICAYLMKKWLHGAEANCDYGVEAVPSIDTAALDYPVSEGKSALLHSVTGSVMLTKTGLGTMYLEGLGNKSGGLCVAAGTLKLKSIVVSRDNLPGCPYLHLDASDTNTMTFAEGSETSIAAWRDVRGAGHPTANVINAGKYPTLVADGLNNMSVVNYPGLQESSQIADVTGFAIPETDRLYAVFKVLGGVGGGVISGHTGVSGNPVVWNSGGEMHTVNKTLGGHAAGYNWFNSDSGYAIGQGLTYLPNPGGTMFRINGVHCNPTATAHASGAVELLAYNGYDHIWTDSIGCCYGERRIAKWKGENGYNGEVILYTNTLSRASALKVEAYLNKKWFGKDTPGYRPAETGRLVVEAGAELEIYGGVPVTASEFACAGSVVGSVALAEGATLKLAVDENGAVSPLDVSGGIDFSRGGTVVLTGGKLRAGVYPLAANAGAGLGEWSVVGVPRGRNAAIFEANGVVSLVMYGGTMMIVR